MEHIKQILEEIKANPTMIKNTLPENTEVDSLNTNCKICNGSGFVHSGENGIVDYSNVVACECSKDKWEKERRSFMMKKCTFPPGADGMSFETFKTYPEIKTAYDDSMEMAKHPGDLSWLVYTGKNGNGKTHLAVSICKKWLEAGIPAKYELVSLLLEELREGINHNGEESYERRFAYYCNVPLLLMDDYGVESPSRWVQEKLDTLIDYRMMNNLSLIITSNLSLDEMPPRIKSRIIRHPCGKVIAIMADDYAMRGKV